MIPKKILIVFGTRPEAIKMAPLVKEFLKNRILFDTKVCVTAQHRQMLDQVLDFFEITPDFDLDLMKPNQNLYTLSADILLGLKKVLEVFRPDYLFVHGDTTTSSMAALAGYYAQVKVCHVEAGLRTYNKYAPFPEELNRQITGRIADFHFAPTEKAKMNLLSERINENKIIVTGNTVIDALHYTIDKLRINDNLPEIKSLKAILDGKPIILVTGHRRENFGEGFVNICYALKEIAIHENVQIIYPVHLNPNVRKPVNEILGSLENIRLIEPLSYPAFTWLMNKSHIVLTDSGGIQEEAPGLGKPVLVMRETTERPEAVEAGTVKLVGTNVDKIVSETKKLLSDTEYYFTMSKANNPYGDGHASTLVVNFINTMK